MMLRLTSSSFAGTTRKLVAVGTPRLASMFETITAPAPRIGSPASSGAGAAVAAPERAQETGLGRETGLARETGPAQERW